MGTRFLTKPTRRLFKGCAPEWSGEGLLLDGDGPSFGFSLFFCFKFFFRALCFDLFLLFGLESELEGYSLSIEVA